MVLPWSIHKLVTSQLASDMGSECICLQLHTPRFATVSPMMIRKVETPETTMTDFTGFNGR